jgi:methylmalonyl-CoA mutase N-terminal domain/subunit
MQMRFHTQTAGVSLTAQQPEVNLVRTAIEALAGVLGGTQSLHTNAYDEALALPTEKAARLALRTQQVIAHESRVANVADPLGGSWYLEALTDELERRASDLLAHVEALGGGSMLEGVLAGIEQGWFQGEIAESAYELERKLNDGRHVVVGVNAYFEGNEEPAPEILEIGPQYEDKQKARLAAVRADRSDEAVAEALEALGRAAGDPTANLVPPILEAVRTYATVGEIMDRLASVFGRWREDPVL